MERTRLQKFQVCDQCFSVGRIYSGCVCDDSNYTVITLEFEVCTCCGHLINDGTPADTPFNEEQLKKIKR